VIVKEIASSVEGPLNPKKGVETSFPDDLPDSAI
jgi:hypothetical protein